MVFTSTISPPVKIGLRLIGALPNMQYAVVYRLIYLSSFLIVQYFQYVYILVHFKLGNLQNVMDSMVGTLSYSSTSFKLMTLWKNHRVVHELLAVIDTDWRECANVDRYLHLMARKASISHFCSNAMFGLNILAGTLYVMGDTAFANANLAQGDNDTSRPFPIKILFPFDAEQSPIYEVLVVVLFIQSMLNVYIVTVVDVLLFTLVLHASGQINIICNELKTVSEEITCYGFPGRTVGMLIDRHNRVITFSGNVDQIFSFIALQQVFLSSIITCALGLLFMTTADITGVGLVRSILVYCANMMEILIICVAGEYFSLKSKSLAEAAYDTLWYNMSSDQAKNILFVILRSQKQLTLTVGGMANLSLQTFANIMKTTASYISVLHAMY